MIQDTLRTRCAGCGLRVSGIGALGQHSKSSKTCTPAMRFWGKVNKTPTCWLWIGAPNQKGYGQTTWGGQKNLVVHRLSWRLANGEIPAGIEVCHKCDTPACVRPSHLFLGTHQENMDDCYAKRRHVFGERQRSAKLTEPQVLEILSLKGTATALKVSKPYGVHQSAVTAIWRGRTWKHLQEKS